MPGKSADDHVAEAVRIVRASGLPSETNAMSANVEGEWDEIMPVIRGHVSARSRKQRARATVTIKLDRRPGQPAGRLRLDVESVERPLR